MMLMFVLFQVNNLIHFLECLAKKKSDKEEPYVLGASLALSTKRLQFGRVALKSKLWVSSSKLEELLVRTYLFFWNKQELLPVALDWWYDLSLEVENF